MKATTLLLFSCVLAGPLLAQTQIGGGSCNSASLTGAYAFTLTGRQISTTGTFTGVFQANGTATFDGSNKVTLTMAAGTIQTVGTSLTYSGLYSVQSNCAGTVTITLGDSAMFSLAVYNQGKAFLLTGADANYAYTGGGNTQPSGCLASMLAGVYTFNGTGYGLVSGAVNGVRDAAGLLQFDGHSVVTVNITTSATGQTPAALTLTGTYSLNSSCVGTASVADSQGNSYSLSFSISASNRVSATTFDLVLAQPSKLLVSGTGHAIYGQPTAAAIIRHWGRGVRSGGAA